jgi:4-diphosphocytidyl-2-C-methyl-D-erythritol kinase
MLKKRTSLSKLGSLMRGSSPECVVLYPPAKVNFYLEVLNRRPDGYHNLETIMATIDLRDTLVVRKSAKTTLVTEPDMGLPPEKNLVIKAQKALESYVSKALPAEFRLVKKIPVGAGLGGGSSDAAAAIRALNIVYGLGLADSEMEKVSANVGSDVAFFIHGGWALCRGRGEQITRLRMGGRVQLVVVFPEINLPTANVYQNLKRRLTENGKNVNWTKWLVSASHGIVNGHDLLNRLEASALSLEPALEEVKKALNRDGSVPWGAGSPVMLTGSGSAFVILAKGKDVSRAASIAHRRGWKVFVTHTCANI